MRRVILLALLLLGVAAPAASAHPLGNFSINRMSEVRISADRVDVRYLLDQAEVPTVAERGLDQAEVLRRKRAEVASGLRLTVDGRPVPLRLAPGGRLSFPPGQAGLTTTRLELRLSAPAERARRVELRDRTFDDRIGWRAIVAAPGEGTAVRTDAPTGDPTRGLRTYPEDLQSRPADRRLAGFTVRPGKGELTAPKSEGAPVRTRAGGQDGFAGLFAAAASGEAVLILLLLAAAGWGALHALSPGHGKAMVAAYLVGTRGGARHAVALGAIVTVTHTIGVFALGVVTLGLSQYVLPEDLYPWLTLISGLLVVAVGAGVLRSRARHARHHHHHHHHHETPSWRGVLGMGAAAGLIPCPSALVVLLAAISQHEVALGLGLITAFSLGLATTLTALGLIVVYARDRIPRLRRGGRIVAALPSLSALVIVGVGCVLTAKALPGVV